METVALNSFGNPERVKSKPVPETTAEEKKEYVLYHPEFLNRPNLKYMYQAQGLKDVEMKFGIVRTQSKEDADYLVASGLIVSTINEVKNE